MQTIKFLIITTLFSIQSFAGGVVGNGAGLVEQNIQFVYLSLPKIIESCISLPNQCSVTPEELIILEKIEVIVRRNYSTQNRIIFMSEKLNPGFFTTSSTENNRVAKTSLNSSMPIYFNVDEIYDSAGKPALDFAGISAILVHELGHQTGEPSHAKLDILGAKVRLFLSFKFVNFEYSFSSSQSGIEMNIVNYPMPSPIGDIYLSTDSGASIQLTSFVMQALTCGSRDDTLIGYNINNGHWNIVAGNAAAIDFESWVQVTCRSSNQSGGVLSTSNHDLLVRVSDKGEVLKLTVQ